MSVYETWLSVDADDHDVTCAKWDWDGPVDLTAPHAVFDDGRTAALDPAVVCTCGAGPLVYAGSNVVPHATDPRGGSLDVAAVPDWCHPDAPADGTDAGPPVDFLRLSVREDPATYHGNRPGMADVVLDRATVVAVHEVLGQWLTRNDATATAADGDGTDGHGDLDGDPDGVTVEVTATFTAATHTEAEELLDRVLDVTLDVVCPPDPERLVTCTHCGGSATNPAEDAQDQTGHDPEWAEGAPCAICSGTDHPGLEMPCARTHFASARIRPQTGLDG